MADKNLWHHSCWLVMTVKNRKNRHILKIKRAVKLNSLTPMNMVLPEETEAKGSSLKIKGRIMLHEEFSSRFQNMCTTLGFGNVKTPEFGNFDILDSLSDTVQNDSEIDAVIVLSCKVHYNPNWGGFCGHPQLLTRMKTGKDELCPSTFLAPFLQLYYFAQQQIYLSKTREGKHLITLPKAFLEKDEEGRGSKLIIFLDKVAEPDENGALVPVSTSGSRCSYNISMNLRQALDAQDYDWKAGGSRPIGRHLGADMFSFTRVEQIIDQHDPFHSTLSPFLHHLVTHRTPHLRAAEIHLRNEFSRAVALLTAERQAMLPNFLCLVGLDIDMAPFAGHGEKYFVPWKAYLERVDGNIYQKCSLDQDELFVRLIQ